MLQIYVCIYILSLPLILEKPLELWLRMDKIARTCGEGLRKTKGHKAFILRRK